MTLVRLAGSGEALDEAGQRLVGLLGAQRAHVQGAVQVGAADAAELARLAHRGAGAVSLWREPDERGQRFGHERGDVGQLGRQDDRGDLTQSGDAMPRTRARLWVSTASVVMTWRAGVIRASIWWSSQSRCAAMDRATSGATNPAC
jgi:hypothetical protein